MPWQGEAFSKRFKVDLGFGLREYTFRGFWKTGDRLVSAQPVFNPDKDNAQTFRTDVPDMQMGFDYYFNNYDESRNNSSQTTIMRGNG